ncbi:MAG: BLUF domain-containing protein [Planctomycetaceae bacterium]|nr:BLUF domain-containing protein [Planctomycetaceae bacterium]
MHLLVYTSEFCGDECNLAQEVRQIVDSARQRNSTLGITGVMFHHRGRFLQFLEGPQPQVQSLMERISRDPRHRNIRILFDEQIDRRGFPDWSMDSFHISNDATLQLEFLEMVRDGYRRNFRTRTATLVEIFRGFVNNSSELQILH